MSGEIEFVNMKREFQVDYKFADRPDEKLWCVAVVKYHGDKHGHKADVIITYASGWKDRFKIESPIRNENEFSHESALEFVETDCKGAIIDALDQRYGSDGLDIIKIIKKPFESVLTARV